MMACRSGSSSPFWIMASTQCGKRGGQWHANSSSGGLPQPSLPDLLLISHALLHCSIPRCLFWARECSDMATGVIVLPVLALHLGEPAKPVHSQTHVIISYTSAYGRRRDHDTCSLRSPTSHAEQRSSIDPAETDKWLRSGFREHLHIRCCLANAQCAKWPRRLGQGPQRERGE